MPYSMMLDSGHGGSDPGAVYRGRREKDDTLRLTLAVERFFRKMELRYFTPGQQMCICPHMSGR